MKGIKRGHISDATSSPSLKVNPKKKDDKETPKKNNSVENGIKMSEIKTFGTDEWCGSREKCNNNKTAATTDNICEECKYNTHIECIAKGFKYCLWCEELLTLQAELTDTSVIPWENPHDDSFDSNDSNLTAKERTDKNKKETSENSILSINESCDEKIEDLPKFGT
jgi:hypothetical protein